MASVPREHAEFQPVPTDNPTRRVHEIHVANVALRIEGPLHDQRADMRAAREHGAPAVRGKLEIERCQPAGAILGSKVFYRHLTKSFFGRSYAREQAAKV